MIPVMIATLLAGLIGWGHVFLMKKGIDIPDFIWNYYKAKEPSANTSKKSKRKASAKRKMQVVKDDDDSVPQAEIDRILDKILEQGQNSLTKEERDTLFRAKDEDESTHK